MGKRIAAIVFIFCSTAIAWAILGSTIFYRTYESSSSLSGRVASTWGTPHEQRPPTATYSQMVPSTIESEVNGKKVERTMPKAVSVPLPFESSHINVALDLDCRRKGLLWYSTYKVDFSGAYVFRNPSGSDQNVTFTLGFPTEQAIYDDLVFSADDAPMSLTTTGKSASGTAGVAAGKAVTLKVGYRSQGLESWRYNWGGEVAQVRDFTLRMTTNFKDIDFPENALSPTEKREVPGGWELVWAYKNLVSGFQIAMLLPEKLQPGPLAGRISYFAPVSLFFFFFLMFILATLRNIELHPMNYFFLASAFFSFHLLLAYLADHISIHLTFLICSAVSIFLVVSYLRLVVGMRFAAVEAGLAQLVYLILFSYAFFFKGFTGLAITIGSIITLFVVMQMTGRISWAERFRGRAAPAEASPRRT
jgi:inner membrane protein involved in colicin E2 resistance